MNTASIKKNRLLVPLTGIFMLMACSSNTNFQYSSEDLQETNKSGEINTENPNPPTPDPLFWNEEFIQKQSSKVDLLWVIDNSGSMDEEQSQIADNAESFTNQFAGTSIDLHLAVITTDPSRDERISMNNFCGILTQQTLQQFASCSKVGISGSALEEGIEAARRALDPNYLNQGTPLNPGFLRADADTQIVFVSDEEDQPSTILSNWNAWEGKHPNLGMVLEEDLNQLASQMGDSLQDQGRLPDGKEIYLPLVENHLEFFKNLKPAQQFMAHAISLQTIDSEGCSIQNNSEETEHRYSLLAELTQGTSSHVCGDWQATMNQLGLSATGLRKCFELSFYPKDISQLQVWVNGTLSSEAVYKEVGNQICFATEPSVGSIIKVRYPYTPLKM